MFTLNFFKPFLKSLDDGKIFIHLVAFLLRTFGILSLLFGFYIILQFAKTPANDPSAIFGKMMYFIFIILGTLAIVQIFFYRAEKISELEEEYFTLIPITSILLKGFGEIYATLSFTIGIGGCIFFWFAGYNPISFFNLLDLILPEFYTEGNFLNGLFFLIKFSIISFIIIVTFYFLAECVIVFADIANNIRKSLQDRQEQ